MATILSEGELPSLSHFNYPARKLRSYLSAMEEIFFVRRVIPHEKAIAKEYWIFFDSGLTAHLMNHSRSKGAPIALIRHFIWNEWISHAQASGKRLSRYFYKSAKGPVIDAVFKDIPIKIVDSEVAITRRLSIEERPLRAAMKALGSKTGYLIGPVDAPIPPSKNDGVGILPWTAWS
jgi:predicted AAA+ superfamily ATPase